MILTEKFLIEATQGELEDQLAGLRTAYDLRKSEMEDDELWSHMGKGAKVSYMTKLKGLEADINRIEKRLQRVKAAPAELVEEPKMEDYIEDQKEGDIEDEIIAGPEKTECDPKHMAQALETNITVDEAFQEIRKGLEVRRSMEGVIATIEDMIINNAETLPTNVIGGLSEILSKFKELKNVVEGVATLTPEPKSEGLIDEVIDADPGTAPVIEPEDNRLLIKGDMEESFEGNFTGGQIADIVRKNFKVEDEEEGMLVIEVKNPFDSSSLSEEYYKIIVYYGDNRLGVYSDYNDEDGKRIAEEVERQIVEELAKAPKIAKPIPAHMQN
jgi:hypothetical protein